VRPVIRFPFRQNMQDCNMSQHPFTSIQHQEGALLSLRGLRLRLEKLDKTFRSSLGRVYPAGGVSCGLNLPQGISLGCCPWTVFLVIPINTTALELRMDQLVNLCPKEIITSSRKMDTVTVNQLVTLLCSGRTCRIAPFRPVPRPSR